MRARRFALNLIAVAAAVLLSGCYVTSQKMPASTGPAVDPQLVGSWRALDEDGKPDNTFLHFLGGDDKKPLTLMMVDHDNWTSFELTSLKVGTRQMFAARQLQSLKSPPDRNYAVGFYEVKGDTLQFWLPDPDKIKAAMAAHQLKGHVEKNEGGKTVLTGSPKELADFFANTDMAKLTGDKPARARRLSTSQ